jgi:hypothetical protein
VAPLTPRRWFPHSAGQPDMVMMMMTMMMMLLLLLMMM